MPMTCEDIRERLDAWALGALDEDDAREVDRHLTGCSECTLLGDRARETAGMLALAVPLEAASDTLRGRVMAAASKLRDEPRRSQAGFPYWPAMAAAIAVVGLGLGAWGVNMRNQINNLEDDNAAALAAAQDAHDRYATVSTQLVMVSDEAEELVEAQDAVTEIVSQEDAERLSLDGVGSAVNASGRYVWSRTAGMGSLVVRNLPVLAGSETYYLWMVYDAAWVIAGHFDVDEEGTGRLIVEDLAPVPANAGKLVAYAVSVEPDDDASERTGAVVLQGAIP